jgi:hypothetical protein
MKIVLKTHVPDAKKRWWRIYTLFIIFAFLFGGVDSYIQFQEKGTVPDDTVLALMFMGGLMPFGLMWLIPPMFFGGYPAWIVSLFGEKFLTELMRGTFEQRSLSAAANRKPPKNWWAAVLQRRYGLVALLVFFAIAGLLSGWLGAWLKN